MLRSPSLVLSRLANWLDTVAPLALVLMTVFTISSSLAKLAALVFAVSASALRASALAWCTAASSLGSLSLIP